MLRTRVGQSREPDDTIPYVRAGIENFRSGVWFQEFGWGPVGSNDAVQRPLDGSGAGQTE